jgi:hypothetical protein
MDKKITMLVNRKDVLSTIDRLVALASAANERLAVQTEKHRGEQWVIDYWPESDHNEVCFYTPDEDYMQWVVRQTFFDEFAILCPGERPLRYVDMFKDTRFNYVDITPSSGSYDRVRFVVDKTNTLRTLQCSPETLLSSECLCYLKHCDFIKVLAYYKNDVDLVGGVLCLRLDQPIQILTGPELSVEQWQSLDVLRHRKDVTFCDTKYSESNVAVVMNMWLMSL